MCCYGFKNRIANVARTIHIDAFTSAMDKRGEEEHEELLYNSTRAVLATTINDASGTLTACEIVLRYHFSNKGKEISSFDVSTRTIAMLASVVDALTNMIKRKEEEEEQRQRRRRDGRRGKQRQHLVVGKTKERSFRVVHSSIVLARRLGTISFEQVLARFSSRRRSMCQNFRIEAKKKISF